MNVEAIIDTKAVTETTEYKEFLKLLPASAGKSPLSTRNALKPNQALVSRYLDISFRYGTKSKNYLDDNVTKEYGVIRITLKLKEDTKNKKLYTYANICQAFPEYCFDRLNALAKDQEYVNNCNLVGFHTRKVQIPIPLRSLASIYCADKDEAIIIMLYFQEQAVLATAALGKKSPSTVVLESMRRNFSYYRRYRASYFPIIVQNVRGTFANEFKVAKDMIKNVAALIGNIGSMLEFKTGDLAQFNTEMGKDVNDFLSS